MSKESEITPFTDSSKTSNSSSDIAPRSVRMRRVYTALKWGGLAGFWIQVFLGVVSSVTLASAITNRAERSSPGVGFSLFCAVCGLICLVVGIYIAFKYGKIAAKFNSPKASVPKKSSTINIIRIAIITSIVGTTITILGAETIAGIVLSKTLALDPTKIFNNRTNTEFVNSLDVFIIQACINIIAAHFAGLVSSMWILTRIDK